MPFGERAGSIDDRAVPTSRYERLSRRLSSHLRKPGFSGLRWRPRSPLGGPSGRLRGDQFTGVVLLDYYER